MAASSEQGSCYRLFFEARPEGMLVVSGEGVLLDANQKACDVLGYAREELLEVGIHDILDPSDSRSKVAFGKEGVGDESTHELRLLRCDGTAFLAELSLTVSSDEDGGGLVGVVFREREVDRRARIERAPRENGGRLGALVESASGIITILEPDGTIRYANPAVEQTLGYPLEELIGRNALDYVHPDDRQRARRFVVEGPDGIVGGSAEFRFRHADGSWLYLEAKGEDLSGGWGEGVAVSYRDITEPKKVEEALRRSEGRYRAVVEQTSENILFVEAKDKHILEANAALYETLGYTSEELRRLTLYDVVAHDPDSIDHDVRRIPKERRSFIGERKYRHKNGSLVDVEVGASVILYDHRKALCIVAHDVSARKRTEKQLQRSLDALLAIYEAGHILGSTLEAEEIGSRLLQLMQRISSSVTAVISVPNDQRQLRVWRAIGFENLWRRARYTPVVQDTLRAVMEGGQHKFSLLQPPKPGVEPLVALFLPLRIRNRTVGVLEVYGPDAMHERDVLDILLNLTTKAASALENARLYGKLAERERQLQDLVGRLMVMQEEERRRIAYEVHDGPTQVAVAAYQHLQAFARMHPPVTSEGRRALQQAVEFARQTVGESRQIIENLRPTVLDDFGLGTAIRLQVESFRAEGWRVTYVETLGGERIPNPVESALYRVAQEALVNVRKHARTTRVRVRLSRLRKGVRLQVRDCGVGITYSHSPKRGPGEQVGLAGMRERVALVGGKFRVHSREGIGTLVTADVPLAADDDLGLMQRLNLPEHFPMERDSG